jgi:hypothetical protein
MPSVHTSSFLALIRVCLLPPNLLLLPGLELYTIFFSQEQTKYKFKQLFILLHLLSCTQRTLVYSQITIKNQAVKYH